MNLYFLLFAFSASVFAAEPVPAKPASANGANPHAGMPAMHAPVMALTQQGTVLSTINVPMYTYVEVAQGKKTVWLAATSMAVKKGDTIHFDDGMAMNNFYSKSLKRNFPSIIFVNRATVGSGK